MNTMDAMASMRGLAMMTGGSYSGDTLARETTGGRLTLKGVQLDFEINSRGECKGTWSLHGRRAWTERWEDQHWDFSGCSMDEMVSWTHDALMMVKAGIAYTTGA